jgi:pyruvate/2-oxoglutarate dehydrogenase complex dihydrolipoamide dehydrogenase (E3) component
LYEVLVVGGGLAGVAALRARERGAEVALVERGTMGGTYTNDGCVPTRVLAHAARLVRDAVLGMHIVGEQAVEVVQGRLPRCRSSSLPPSSSPIPRSPRW